LHLTFKVALLLDHHLLKLATILLCQTVLRLDLLLLLVQLIHLFAKLVDLATDLAHVFDAQLDLVVQTDFAVGLVDG